MNCFAIACWLFIWILPLSASAQSTQTILFDRLTVDKGLSQNSGIAVGQDKQGLIWIGTRYGLNRYDGYRFKIYQDNNGLKDNYIHAIHCDRQGIVWIGTEAGLHYYNTTTDTIKQIPDPVASVLKGGRMVIDIFEDKNGRLWISTECGLKLLAKNRHGYEYTLTTSNSGLPSNNIRCCYQDAKGNVWVGTENGLCKITYHNNKPAFEIFRSNNHPNSISDNYVTCITEDRNRNLWIATQNGGLNLYQPNNNRFIWFKHTESAKSIISNVIRKIETDVSGNLWIGTLDGLSIMDIKSHECTSYQYEGDNNKSLSQNSIYSIFRDKNGSMWVGSYYGGVNVAYPYTTQFKAYYKTEHRSSINNNNVSSILEDQHKNLWIGTEGGGLNFYNRKTEKFSTYTANLKEPAALRSNLVKCLFIDSKKNLWVGTHGGGLNRLNYQTKTFQQFLFDPLSPKSLLDEVNTIIEDEDGKLWVGTQKSGILISNTAHTAFTPFNNTLLGPKIKNRAITSLLKNRDELWIGTSYGLFRLNLKKNELTTFKAHYGSSNSLNIYTINCIVKTKDEKIWIGTYYGGLSSYDGNTNAFKTYTDKDGLPNNNVLGILTDEGGNLWVSTANGLSSFNPRLKLFRNYMVSDGLTGNEFNNNSFYKSNDGEMFFGGHDGFISFHPDKIQANTKSNEIVLDDIKFQDRSIKSLKNISGNINNTDEFYFDHDQNTFSVTFALLNFIKPQKNHYFYKLDSYEKKWNYTTIPSVNYVNLPPGSYHLLIKGVNNDGISSRNIKDLKITVSPPLYRSWWAYTLYVIATAMIVVLFVRYLLIKARLKREKEVNASKLNFFTNISHEIRTPLTLIIGPLENLIEEVADNPKMQKSLLPIKNNADRLMGLVTELLDFRKAESGKMLIRVSPGNIVMFCKTVFDAFEQMALAKSIDYRFISPVDDIELYFDKVQLEKVMFNLLSNAIKFSPQGGEVVLRIDPGDQFVRIDISNQGAGIPTEYQPQLFEDFYQSNATGNIGTGLGLSLSKSLIELHKGNISFISTPADDSKTGYTCFTIGLRTGKTHFSETEIALTTLNKGAAYLVKPVPQLVHEETTPVSAKHNYTILVVEDNSEIRSLIRSSLQNNYQVIEKEDGVQGWEIATTTLPDLVISDVMMPNMDGLELCRMLKTDERTSHIPVVLLTARTAHEHLIHGLETGADIYITKPFSNKTLQLNIRNLLNAREILRKRFSQVQIIEPKGIIVNSTEQNFLNKIISIIEDNIAEPDFMVSVLASEIGMSKPVLYKKIRALTDLSVNDFIKSIRLKKAARLLENKQGNIAEIAYSVGFTDRKYFSIEFKKFFGKSPSKYIENNN